jgi:RNA polymerase sigma-70 factor (ECF subfamily)
MQETLLKAYATLPQLHQPLYPKSYLFRIASNTWIDICRKKNPGLIQLEDETELIDTGTLQSDEVIGSIEMLIEMLPPRQVVLILLIDVFDFKLGEAADLLSTTEATVKSALQRARSQLRKGVSKINVSKEGRNTPTESSHRLLDLFIDAYNRRDAKALVGLMDEHISEQDAPVFQVYGRDQMEKSVLASWVEEPRFIQARYQKLWDRTVIVVTNRENEMEYLHGIMELTIEDEKIVMWRDYYFSKEFLLRASDELNLPLDNSKNLFGN